MLLSALHGTKTDVSEYIIENNNLNLANTIFLDHSHNIRYYNSNQI
jgi:hypothetical protein